MKFVILFFATFCSTIYLTSGQTPSEKACVNEKFTKSCEKHCPELEEIGKSEPDVKNTTKHCCPISRCIKCFEDIGLNKCGPEVELRFRQLIADFNILFVAKGCTESEKYPSFKCLYHFYSAWFFVVSLVIQAVIGGAVAFVVRRRRRCF